MSSAPSNALTSAENLEMQQKRLYTLQVRCVQEIRLLSKKLNDFQQQACRQALQQRLQELQQRQQFYQAQLSSLACFALA